MSVLVTGGAGYIGGHMTLGLMDAGETVVVLDNLSTGFAWAVPDGAKFVVGDTGDADLVARLIAEHEVDAVAHFAAKIVVPESVIDPLDYYLNNTSNARTLGGGWARPCNNRACSSITRRSNASCASTVCSRESAGALSQRPTAITTSRSSPIGPQTSLSTDPTAVGRRHHLCRDRGRLRLRRRDPRRLVAPRRRLCDQSLDRRQTDDGGPEIRNRATKAAAGLQA